MSDAEWREVPGFPRYEVSDAGLVRSRRRARTSGGILAGSPNRHGYRCVKLYDGGAATRTGFLVHSLVLLAFVGPRPFPGAHIRHLDGDPANNRLSNLRYGTVSENQHDSLEHGRHYNATLTHCLRGHEFTPENTYRAPSGEQRFCRECRAADSRRRYAARKAARAAQTAA